MRDLADQADFDRIESLRSLIRKFNEEYYTLNSSSISDEGYDALFQELQGLEKRHPEWVTSDSPTQRVSGSVQEEFHAVRHDVPMLSIETETDVSNLGAEKFDARVRRDLELMESDGPIEYFAELKFDGLAISLRYEGGKLSRAATRGDGAMGDDVTQNVRMIRRIPFELTGDPPEVLEVRGEIFITKRDFEELNRIQAEQGKELFVNPRNTAAGALRQLDTSITERRQLSFFAYGVGVSQGWQLPQKQDQLLSKLAEMGVPVCETREIAYGATGLAAFHCKVGGLREHLPFEIDGVVYKVNDVSLQQKLGLRTREPKWAIAHKFPPQERTTTVESIDIQVGRTGKLTPVAKLSPVFVGGVTVSNATLHNQDEVLRKDVRKGDTVLVRRAGDVIPEIVRVIRELRPPEVEADGPYDIFQRVGGKCPACKSSIAREPDGVDWRCTAGLACPDQRLQMLVHFCHRSAMDIDGLGVELIGKLVECQVVDTPASLYSLTKEQLKGLVLREEPFTYKDGTVATKTVRIQDDLAEKLVNSIAASKSKTLDKLIFGIGIRNVGERSAQDIANFFGNQLNISDACYETLMFVPNLGEVTARSITDYFGIDANKAMFRELLRVIDPMPPVGYQNLKFVAFEALMPRLSLSGMLTKGTKAANAISAKFVSPRDLISQGSAGTELTDDERRVYDALIEKPWPEVLTQLESVGVKWGKPIGEQKAGGVSGKTFVITGNFEQISRADLTKQISLLGAKVTSSVSSRTDYVIVGEAAGSKRDAAIKLGIPTLTFDEFRQLIDEGKT